MKLYKFNKLSEEAYFLFEWKKKKKKKRKTEKHDISRKVYYLFINCNMVSK